MSLHTVNPTTKALGGILAAAVATCSFAVAALGPAPTANATCASFFGIGNGGGCTSTFGTVAIAIGTGASAEASGFFSTALAVGPDSRALSEGTLGTAVAFGATGGSEFTFAGAGGSSGDFLNTVISLGNDSQALTEDGTPNFGNLALNIGQGTDVRVAGTFNNAINVGGNEPFRDNTVSASGVFSNAYSFFGNENNITAGPGPFAIAGSLFQTGAHITRTGPGFNINGATVGAAAAPAKATTSVKAAAVGSSKKGSTGSTAPAKHASKNK
jgi:hypothetical protein